MWRTSKRSRLYRKGDKEMALRGLKKINSAIAALIEALIKLSVGDTVTLVVDSASRINTMKNHTATHLLQAALIATTRKTSKPIWLSCRT